MDLEEVNPYDISTLREAWRHGWEASMNGEARHVDILYVDESERAKAWRSGYESADSGGPEGFNPDRW